MCHTLISDATFWNALLLLDRELAASVRRSGCCFCGHPLHRSDYQRKPRGGPDFLDQTPDFALRYSFCCSREGCRRRHAAPSVRFLGRRVYYGVTVILTAALAHGFSESRVRQLRRRLGLDRRTFARWRCWWVKTFPSTALWRALRGRLSPPIKAEDLPSSLLGRFDGAVNQQLLSFLRFLSPLSASQAPTSHAF